MDKDTYNEVVRTIKNLLPQSSLVFGTVTAFDTEKRLMKVMLEPSEIETGWCKVAQGAFSDKIGIEVLVGVVIGNNAEQYIVLNIIE